MLVMDTIPPLLQQLLPKSLQKIWKAQQVVPCLSSSAEYLDAASERDAYASGSLVRTGVSKEQTLKSIIALKKEVTKNELCLTNTVAEARMLLLRVFGRGGEDRAMGFAPLHAEWATDCAQLQLGLDTLPLYHQMELPMQDWSEAQSIDTRILILEHPNTITGLPLRSFDVADIAANFEGLIILDESAIACCAQESLAHIRTTCSNVVILQRFFGTVGTIIAHPDLIAALECFKAPVLEPIADLAMAASGQAAYPLEQVQEERKQLRQALEKLPHVQRVFPSATNTLLLELDHADESVEYLRKEEFILIHRVPSMPGLEEGVRLTIGTPLDNLRLLKALERLPQGLNKHSSFWQNVSNGLRRASAFLGVFKKILGGGI